MAEPKYRPLQSKLVHAPKSIRSLIKETHIRLRNGVGQATAEIELGFLRGYQGGYEDAMRLKQPKHYVREFAMERLKELKKRLKR